MTIDIHTPREGLEEKVIHHAKQAMIVGIVSSGLIGYACIRFLLDYLAKKPLKVFMVYRIALGALVIGLSLAGWLKATPKQATAPQPQPAIARLP